MFEEFIVIVADCTDSTFQCRGHGYSLNPANEHAPEEMSGLSPTVSDTATQECNRLYCMMLLQRYSHDLVDLDKSFEHLCSEVRVSLRDML